MGRRMTDVSCLLEVRWRGQVLQRWELRERDISCGGLKKEIELVVWELW